MDRKISCIKRGKSRVSRSGIGGGSTGGARPGLDFSVLDDLLEKLCAIADCQPEIKGLLMTIASQPQLEGIALIKYCDKEGNTTGFAGTILDEDTGETKTLYFDANLEPVGSAPEGVPCPEKDIELKTLGPIEKCDADKAKYYGFYCKLFVNGIEQEQTQFWVLPDGTTATAMPEGLEDCPSNPIVLQHEQCLSDGTVGLVLAGVDPQTGNTLRTKVKDMMYEDVGNDGNGDPIVAIDADCE